MWKWKCPKCNEINEEPSDGNYEGNYLCKNCIQTIDQNEIIYPYEKEDEDFPDGVELITASYDWECPNCGQWNNIDEWGEKVRCNDCGKKFDVTGVTNP